MEEIIKIITNFRFPLLFSGAITMRAIACTMYVTCYVVVPCSFHTGVPYVVLAGYNVYNFVCGSSSVYDISLIQIVSFFSFTRTILQLKISLVTTFQLVFKAIVTGCDIIN